MGHIPDFPDAIGPVLAFFGGKEATPEVNRLLRSISKSITSHSNFRVVTSAYKGNLEKNGSFSAAYLLVMELLNNQPAFDPSRRLMTFNTDQAVDEYFSAGRQVQPRGKNHHSERLSMVQFADAVILLGGERGIETVCEYCLALEKPVIPLPFIKPPKDSPTAGATKSWKRHSKAISETLGLTTAEYEAFSKLELEKLGTEEMDEVGKRIVDLLCGAIQKTCFVMMPFDPSLDKLYQSVIVPAFSLTEIEAVRIDKNQVQGNIFIRISQEIANSSCGLAILDGYNPNVMYEVGLSHASKKPVLLLLSEDTDIDSIPFDLRQHMCLRYPGINSEPTRITQFISDLSAALVSVANQDSAS
ncbi:MAG: hypothetical protein P1U89_02465 [Verrucomicrobiales bacterium]|nr:hypothetical protein [Verrucomicrobiales bacterium]